MATSTSETMSQAEQKDEYYNFIEKGKALCARLESFEWNQPQCSKLEENYKISSGPGRNIDAITDAALASFNTESTSLPYMDIMSIPPGPDTAYSNRFGAEKGVIICWENYKERDRNPPQLKLFPSEILWQCYRHCAERVRAPLSNMRGIFRPNVCNKQTLRALWWSAELSAATTSRRNGLRIYTNVDDGYHALLGSPNGASTMRMLIDHRGEIGFRVVERVVVLPLPNTSTIADLESKEKHRTFHIEWSDCRSVPPPSPPPPSPPRPPQKAAERKLKSRWRF